MDATVELVTKDEDILLVFPLILEEARELGIPKEKINFNKVLEALYVCKTRGALLVAKDKDKVVGIMALTPCPQWFSDEVTLCNLTYFVDAQYRKSLIGLKLLRQAKECAKLKRMELNIMVDSSVDLERKDRLFSLYGFEKRGGTYRFKD
jgi:hypothetical protein